MTNRWYRDIKRDAVKKWVVQWQSGREKDKGINRG
jgi:hypothetical protein